MDYALFLLRLGAEIRRRRKDRLKLNQIDFAQRVGTDQGSISRLENGKQGFDSPLLYRISEAFTTTPGELCAAATHTPLPIEAHPEAMKIARNWHRLRPKTQEAILTLADLDLAAPAAAKGVDSAPASRRPAKIKP